MNPILRYLDKQFAKLVRTYQFADYVLYYLQRGHRFSDAVNLAHKVV